MSIDNTAPVSTPATAPRSRFPSKPNTRTRANLVATAMGLADFKDTTTLAAELGIDYQAAAERIKIMRDSGLYDLATQPGVRKGARGAIPVMYKATLRAQ